MSENRENKTHTYLALLASAACVHYELDPSLDAECVCDTMDVDFNVTVTPMELDAIMDSPIGRAVWRTASSDGIAPAMAGAMTVVSEMENNLGSLRHALDAVSREAERLTAEAREEKARASIMSWGFGKFGIGLVYHQPGGDFRFEQMAQDEGERCLLGFRPMAGSKPVEAAEFWWMRYPEADAAFPNELNAESIRTGSAVRGRP